jgi:hypothetical protein
MILNGQNMTVHIVCDQNNSLHYLIFLFACALQLALALQFALALQSKIGKEKWQRRKQILGAVQEMLKGSRVIIDYNPRIGISSSE